MREMNRCVTQEPHCEPAAPRMSREPGPCSRLARRPEVVERALRALVEPDGRAPREVFAGQRRVEAGAALLTRFLRAVLGVTVNTSGNGEHAVDGVHVG